MELISSVCMIDKEALFMNDHCLIHTKYQNKHNLSKGHTIISILSHHDPINFNHVWCTKPRSHKIVLWFWFRYRLHSRENSLNQSDCLWLLKGKLEECNLIKCSQHQNRQNIWIKSSKSLFWFFLMILRQTIWGPLEWRILKRLSFSGAIRPSFDPAKKS